MFERLAELVAEYDNVLSQLADPAVISDQRRLRDVSRRHKELEPVVEAYRCYQRTEADLATAREMYVGAEGEDRGLLNEEIDADQKRLAEIDDELKVLLLPRDPNDGRNVIMEIRGAEGGEEANLFARDLYEMYLRYFERAGLKAEVLSSDPSPMGG